MVRLLKKQEEIPYDLLLLADDTKEAIDKYIFDSEIFVYEIENKILAVYAFFSIDHEAVEVKNIAVHEMHQGNGIGTKLIYDAIQRAKDRNHKAIYIGTGDASFRQLQLYQKIGFELHEIKKHFFLDNYPDPIFENGIQLKHMVMLKLELSPSTPNP